MYSSLVGKLLDAQGQDSTAIGSGVRAAATELKLVATAAAGKKARDSFVDQQPAVAADSVHHSKVRSVKKSAPVAVVVSSPRVTISILDPDELFDIALAVATAALPSEDWPLQRSLG